MLKKFLLIITILVTLTSISYGAFCNGNTGKSIDSKDAICDQTPDVIEKYIEDMMYILSSLPSSKKEYKNIEGLGSKALDTVGGAYQNSEQVFTDFGTDFFSNFKILFEEKYVVRDRTKVLGLKSYISSKAISEVKKNGLTERVENLKQIKDFIKKSPNFFIEFKGNTYKEIYNYLWTNQQIFEDIYYNRIVKGKSNYKVKSSIISKGQSYTIKTDKVEQVIKQIEKGYFKGGAQPSCSTTWDEFIGNVREIVCSYGGDKTKEALKRFGCNYQRLRNALFGENGEANCGKVPLKPWRNVKDRVKITGIGKIMKDAEEVKNFFTKKVGEIGADIGKMFESKKQYKEKVTVEQKPTEIYKNMVLTNIYDTSDNLIKEHNKIKESFTYIESSEFTHNITRDIVNTSKNIYELGKLADGAGEDYEDSAAGKLTETCLNQSPFVGDCKNDN